MKTQRKKQSIEVESWLIRIFELLEGNFKITMINKFKNREKYW